MICGGKWNTIHFYWVVQKILVGETRLFLGQPDTKSTPIRELVRIHFYNIEKNYIPIGLVTNLVLQDSEELIIAAGISNKFRDLE